MKKSKYSIHIISKQLNVDSSRFSRTFKNSTRDFKKTKELGKHIETFSVVGFNNKPIFFGIETVACSLLIDFIEKKNGKGQHQSKVLPTQLIIRNS